MYKLTVYLTTYLSYTKLTKIYFLNINNIIFMFSCTTTTLSMKTFKHYNFTKSIFKVIILNKQHLHSLANLSNYHFCKHIFHDYQAMLNK